MSSGNRNFICTVVFIDIVGFSKKAVADQLRIKQQLNDVLGAALQPVPPKDRIILDTGDGAAVSFLGDPEDGLFLGLALRDALAADGNTLQLRTGINLGPVRLVKDINNQPNIIGDGINVAQRVMDFAAPNQVLSSRSYYEVISALSAEHAKLFTFEGSRTDKHVREHEIYALGNAPAPQRADAQALADHRTDGDPDPLNGGADPHVGPQPRESGRTACGNRGSSAAARGTRFKAGAGSRGQIPRARRQDGHQAGRHPQGESSEKNGTCRCRARTFRPRQHRSRQTECAALGRGLRE